MHNHVVINLAKDEKEKDATKNTVHRIAYEVYDFADETVAHAEGVPRSELMLECYHKLGTLLAQWAKRLDKIEGVSARPLWLKNFIELGETQRGRPLVDLGRESLGFEIDNSYFAKEKTNTQLSDDLLMVSQPKSMWMEDFRELLKFCDSLGLDFYVDGFNTKLPGRTFRVVVYKPKNGQHKRLDFRENSLFIVQLFEKFRRENGHTPSKEQLIELIDQSGKFEDRNSVEKLLETLALAGVIPKLD